MQKIILTLLFVLFLIVGQTAQSQQTNRKVMIRNRIEQVKLREIKQRLQLDEATFAQFRPIYLRYERRIANIDFKNQARLMKANTDSLSAEEANLLITNQLANAKKMVFIRERFYNEFRKVLTPQQLVKLYQSETEIRRKVMTEIRNRRKEN